MVARPLAGQEAQAEAARDREAEQAMNTRALIDFTRRGDQPPRESYRARRVRERERRHRGLGPHPSAAARRQ